MFYADSADRALPVCKRFSNSQVLASKAAPLRRRPDHKLQGPDL
jgi:hypothetical protein